MKKLPKKIGYLSVKGINPEYNSPQWLTVPAETTKQLRWWQKEAFGELKDSQFSFIVAFCGSGKSLLQVGLAIYDVVNSGWARKQLFVVPQQHIHKGFSGDNGLEYLSLSIEGRKYEWKVTHNFCDDRQAGVVDRLKAWLLKRPEELAPRHPDNLITGVTAIASYQALAIAWAKMTTQERCQAIDNLTLRLDEAHHIRGVFDKDDEDLTADEKLIMEANATSLGEVCHFILNSGNRTSKLSLTTATPYRGDRAMMLSPGVRKRFNAYYLDWLDHWRTLGIREFTVEYEQYVTDPIGQLIGSMAGEKEEYHTVVLPARGQKWRSKDDELLVYFWKKLYREFPKDVVLDLVTPSTQNRNKQKLLQEPKSASDGVPKYRVVVMCQLGREGTDWCPCSRIHNTAVENSLTLAVQTLGRAFRRFGGKTNVRINYYIKKFADAKQGMTKRELLSDRTNALLTSIQLDEMCHPILIPAIPEGKTTTGKPRSTSNLCEAFGDQYQQMKIDLIEEIEALGVKDVRNLDATISQVLTLYGVKDTPDMHDALRALVVRLLSPSLRSLGVDIAFIRHSGFDKIIEEHKLVGSSIFFGEYSKQDWKIIRDILTNNWDEMYEEYKRRKAG